MIAACRSPPQATGGKFDTDEVHVAGTTAVRNAATAHAAAQPTVRLSAQEAQRERSAPTTVVAEDADIAEQFP